ncbi:WD repeat-containing protein 6 isoform X1 [Neodiprion virginianus]|uniref:WD repeat-containing protein 6 isoform X1 n=1 Tax=Neodiprion virginianus TaxID=2961670 RepID=UPI001EE74ED7|nr:WD repeat-containing protein 6 isoform X1 [Neodiprion virginianus]
MSELLSTDVLAVLSVGDYIFVGIGYTLRVYKKSTNNFISKLDVCYPDKIHGIVKGPGNYLAVFGGKQIGIVEVKSSNKTVLTTLYNAVHRFNDWVIAASWCSSNNEPSKLAILFAHNCLYVYDWLKNEAKEFQCEEKCILYGGSVTSDKADNFVVFAGTVFQEIFIWAVRNFNIGEEVPILHRLRGHNGVIFSVTFDPITSLICSTSDDRTIRLWSVGINSSDNGIQKWKNANISLMTTIFGHTARVWRAAIRKDFVISIGEDSLVCIWTKRGTLINKIEAHHGAPIWSIDVSEDGNTIITGGGDGAVHVWPLRANTNFVTKIIPLESSNDVPKHIGLLNSTSMVIITQTGKMLTHNKESGLKEVSLDTTKYASYIVMQISPDRKRVSLASLNGYLTLYEDNSETRCLQRVLEQKIMDSKVLSMHWLNEDSLLVCGLEGCMKTVKIVQGSALVISNHLLPQSRERWTTAAVVHENLLICGDRAGSIHLFRIGDVGIDNLLTDQTNSCHIHPFQSLLKIHGRLGVHSCKIIEDKLLTTGRDGTLRFYKLQKIDGQKTISPLQIDKMPMDWVSITLKTCTDLYVLGFKEVDFVLYSTAHQRVLLRIRCGGGHRSWDYVLNDGNFYFTYIRDKQIHVAKCEPNFLATLAVENGFHTKEVYCIQPIPTSIGHNILISGGEDRILRVTHINGCGSDSNNNQKFTSMALLSGHISSIKTLSLINLQNTAECTRNLIFSGGGRAQLKVWLISLTFEKNAVHVGNLTCVELASHMLRGTDQQQRKSLQQESYQCHYMDPETRYMSINAYRIPRKPNFILLLLGCSDGFLRIFSYDIETRNISTRTAIPYYNRCILMTHLFNYEENLIALTMATDGIVNFWCLNDVVDDIVEDLPDKDKLVSKIPILPFAKLKLHQCGINSYDLKMLKESLFILATGGDDNLLCLVVFEIKSENGVLSLHKIRKWNSASSHSTQVTGLILNESGSLFSVGIDQKVLTFNYRYDDIKLIVSLVHDTITSVADVQGMTMCYANDVDSTLLCTYGKGFELIRRTR